MVIYDRNASGGALPAVGSTCAGVREDRPFCPAFSVILRRRKCIATLSAVASCCTGAIRIPKGFRRRWSSHEKEPALPRRPYRENTAGARWAVCGCRAGPDAHLTAEMAKTEAARAGRHASAAGHAILRFAEHRKNRAGGFDHPGRAATGVDLCSESHFCFEFMKRFEDPPKEGRLTNPTAHHSICSTDNSAGDSLGAVNSRGGRRRLCAR